MRLSSMVLLVCLSITSAAEAESAVDSGPVACAYSDPEVAPPAGDLPANWPVITIGLYGGGFHFDSATLTRTRDGHVVPLVASTLGGLSYALGETLTVGDTYVFAHPICATLAPRTTTYRAVAPIAEPASLGTFEVSGPFSANRYPGVANRFSFLVVRLAPDPLFEAPPWSELRWSIEMDGDASIVSANRMSVHDARMPLDCGNGVGVAEGAHTIGVGAGPVEGLTTIRGAATMSVDMRCADAIRVDDDTLRALTPEEVAYWDETSMDGSVAPDMDGAVRVDGGIDGGNMDMHTEPDTHSNCSVSSSRASMPVWMLVIACLAMPSARRRRARARAAARP